ncbi:MAG: hypothetical protein O7A06_13215 [Acidobacteria bacterium]|nr:hypothetical protein [Acidobacteriota bacterium]
MKNPSPSKVKVKATSAQEAASRLAKFRRLLERGALNAEVIEKLATEAATAFLSQSRGRDTYLRDAVALLAEISTLEEPALAEPGHRATFRLLVENLSDSFDPQQCLLYDRAFAQMITFCRKLPAAKQLDAALQRFGLKSERDLLERKASLRERSSGKGPVLSTDAQRKVRKALVLSRVTLGADVAVTSVVLEKAKRIFPQAERVLIGSPKLAQLFGGDSTLRIRDVRYKTSGGLLDRLLGWLPVIEAVEEETRNLAPEQFVVIDPDSRLLQLGLLPVLRPAVHEELRYFFLESRRYGEPGQGTISRITLGWLNGIFGGEDEIFPAVNLREEDRDLGLELCRKLRQGGAGFLVAASFGVGGNQSKRLPDPFEEQLLSRLLDDGCTVLLDKGVGEEERDRADRLVERVRAGGHAVIELNQRNARAELAARELRCRMLTWQGEIGLFSALVAGCDEYIGYDSAGQHIAAALGVPALDIFTGSASAVFRERWRPTGQGIVRVVAVPPSQKGPREAGTILDEVAALHEKIKSGAIHTEK